MTFLCAIIFVTLMGCYNISRQPKWNALVLYKEYIPTIQNSFLSDFFFCFPVD